MTGVSGLVGVSRLLRRRLLLLIALYAAVLALTVLLMGASLWSTRPYGWDSGDMRYTPFFGFYGRNRLLYTFSPLFAAFYWVSTLGLALAIRRRRDALLVTAGVVTAWPLWSTALFWSLFLIDRMSPSADVDVALVRLLLCGPAIGLVVAAAGVALRRWRSALVPLTVNVLWLLYLAWYQDEWFSVFGD
jgi:hypothetical protein